MTRNFDLNKLKAYKGSVLKDLKVPDSYRSFSATSKKVLRLYLRLHEDQLFFPQLVTDLKDIASTLRFIGVSKYFDKAPQNLIDALEEAATMNVDRWLQFKNNLTLGTGTEVVLEEARERVPGTHCSLCRVSLAFPAYVVRRSEQVVLHRSAALGIKCLRAEQGRLKTFLESEQIASVLRDIKAAMVPA